MKKHLIYIVILTIALLPALSCNKDKGGSGLRAVFSYVADGYKVSFTNFSENAKEYSWNFGDGSGQTSTSRNPQHVFTHKGDYLVSLTAKNGNDTKEFKDTVTITGPNIRIDGDFTDWQYVPYNTVNDAAYTSSIRAIKAFASADQIYIYLEGSADMKMEILDIYMDSDNNPATGFATWYYPVASGADFLMEGSPTGGWGDVFAHQGDPSAFSWASVASFADVMNFSSVKTVSGKNIIEFSIKKSVLGSVSGAVNVGLVESTSGWAEIGQIPAAKQPTSKFLQIQL